MPRNKSNFGNDTKIAKYNEDAPRLCLDQEFSERKKKKVRNSLVQNNRIV